MVHGWTGPEDLLAAAPIIVVVFIDTDTDTFHKKKETHPSHTPILAVDSINPINRETNQ